MSGSGSTRLYVGMRGHVAAIDRTSGAEIWRTKLKGVDFVHLITADGAIYATTRGEVFRLDPATGAVLWKNPMRGLGFGPASLAAEGAAQSDAASTAAEARRRGRQAAGAS